MSDTHTLRWRLQTRADQATAWRLLRDTDTFNRVVDMGFRFTEEPLDAGKVRRTGRVNRLGLKLPWTEQPFDYDEPRRWSTVRIFGFGPVDRYTVSCELEPHDGGTLITYQVVLTPRSPLLMAVVKADANLLVKPKLARGLARAVRFLNGDIGEFDLPPPKLPSRVHKRLAAGLAELTDAAVAERLGDFLLQAPLNNQNMMHPLRLAKAWRLPGSDVVRGCFQAVSAGLLTMHWQLVCPSCRAAKNELDALRIPTDRAHCPSCNIRYDGSFPDSLVVTLRPAAAIRPIELPIECLGSPGRTPSMIAQTTLAPRTAYEWPVDLLAGAYQLRTFPHLETASLQVRRDVQQREVAIAIGPHAVQPPLLRAAPGRVLLRVRNRRDEPMRLAIQRRSVDDTLLTAGRLLELDEARVILPAGSVSAHVQIAIARRVVLAVSVQRGGERAAADVVQSAKASGPESVFVGNDCVIFGFDGAADAIGASMAVQGARHLSAAIVAGPVTYIGDGDREAPGGRTVEHAVALARAGDGGELIVARSGELQAMVRDGPNMTLAARADGTVAVAFKQRDEPPLSPHVDARPLTKGVRVDDRFEIIERVGAGGFGEVFSATDTGSGDVVVVKVLSARHATDAGHVQRFFLEGEMASRLDHPHAVRTLGFGLGMDDRIYIAMEFLRGCELRDVLKRDGVLPWKQAVGYATDALKGLQAAHAAGLVHRDIKPANLFVCDVDGRERVKLIDFGIAVLADPDERDEFDAGRAIGTPQYMSPEQAQADPNIDARSDLYSLAVVLFECLSGGFPFAADSTIGILLARVTDEPLSIEQAAQTDVPAGLAAAIMRALSRHREHRFADADSMRATLDDVLNGKHSPVKPHKKRAMSRTVASKSTGPRAPVKLDNATQAVAQEQLRETGRRIRETLNDIDIDAS